MLCHPQRNVYLTAYSDSASSRVVIVALNLSGSPIQQAFVVPKGQMTAYASYATSKTSNGAQGSDLPVTGGVCIATLDASSITTFVSK